MDGDATVASVANDPSPLRRAFALHEQVGELISAAVSVSPSDPNSFVMDQFDTHPEMAGVAIVENGRPIALINRTTFFAQFARPFARELYINRSCMTFAEQSPLILEESVSIRDASERIAAFGEKALNDGFIIVRDGSFMGLCNGVTFVRALANLLSDQHQRLLSSIDYASTIQTAMLADSRAALTRSFPDRHALVWRPRDVVGGDCFFAAETTAGVLIGLMDCTGHGVPGALLTSIAISEASRLSADPEIRQSPAAVLAHLSRRMKAALQQHKPMSEATIQADDGMDAIFIWAGKSDADIRVASAKLPVLVLDQAGELTTIKGDRKGLGYRDTPSDFEWTDHNIPKASLGRIIMATDGLCDQIGGSASIGFGWSRIRRSLTAAATAAVDLRSQVAALWDAFEAYQADEPRRDDVAILGLDFTPNDACDEGAFRNV